MGSYNYEALHRNTGMMKRPWMVDPLAGVPGYLSGVPIEAPKYNYGNVSLERYIQGYGKNGPTGYDIPRDRFSNGYTRGYPGIVERGGYANGYGNGIQIREPIREVIREPIREAIREVREVIDSPVPVLRKLETPATGEEPLPGMIFGCTTRTYQECMRLGLFGLPPKSKGSVMRVVPGTKLFLYNYGERELSGIFEATSPGDMDIIPEAFRQWGSFPAQVRARCVEECPNLPLKAFKDAIIENFDTTNKFKYELTEAQVRKLVELFRKEAQYWEQLRETEQRKILQLQQTWLQPPVRQPYPTPNENLLELFHGVNVQGLDLSHVPSQTATPRNGKDFGNLVKHPRSSNNGGLLMAGASAPPPPARPILLSNPYPPSQAPPTVLMPPGFVPSSVIVPTPKLEEGQAKSHPNVSVDLKESTSCSSQQWIKKAGDSMVPEGASEPVACSQRDRNTNSPSPSLGTNVKVRHRRSDRWPVPICSPTRAVDRGESKEVPSSSDNQYLQYRFTTHNSQSPSQENPPRKVKEASLREASVSMELGTSTEGRNLVDGSECKEAGGPSSDGYWLPDRPGLSSKSSPPHKVTDSSLPKVLVSAERGTPAEIVNAEGRTGDNGAEITGKHQREGSVKPTSRKKMKASKTRSNVVGKSEKQEVEGVSYPTESTDDFMSLPESTCKMSEDSRHEQQSTFCAQSGQGYALRDITPWKLLESRRR